MENETGTSNSIKAIEFFSGIGAFAEASRKSGIVVESAFDIDIRANQTYETNFGLKPNNRNLDTIRKEQIPDAELWWMSPPCQPYTVRGNQKDLRDPRTKSLVNLLGIFSEQKPKAVLIENVSGFKDTDAHTLLLKTFEDTGHLVETVELDPSDFGVPMRRPRLYFIATSRGASYKPLPLPDLNAISHKIVEFVHANFGQELLIDELSQKRYGESLHVIDAGDPESYAICFTSGYWKSFRASGTYIRLADGRLRRFSPEEIVQLLGFSEGFKFPESLSIQAKIQLAGNSVDVRAVKYLLSGLSFEQVDSP
ncbi:MAG: DNA cytosine methyltransferase [Leptolyngbya sp.]|nr:DNA cytosine methyltransferase [Candidatus Melainabacteria bacterium]